MWRRVSPTLIRSQLCIILFLGCARIVASEEQPNLLELSKALECSSTQQQASSLLNSFHNIELPDRSLPNEWFSSENPPSLHSASLDITLATLVSISERYPELTPDVEQVILQWSYCEVLLDNTFYDFVSVDGELQKQTSDVLSPIDWQGFYAVGFLGDHDDRFVIDAFKHDDAPYAFYELNYSTLFRQQCLPHPQTSKLFYSVDTYFPGRVVHDGYPQTASYPYKWKAGCDVPGEAVEPSVIEGVKLTANSSDESEPKSIASDKPKISTKIKPIVSDKATPKPVAKAKPEPKPRPEPIADTNTKPIAVTNPKAESEVIENTKTKPIADTKSKAESEVLANTNAEPKAVSKVNAVVAAVTIPKAEPKAEPKAVTIDKAIPEVVEIAPAEKELLANPKAKQEVKVSSTKTLSAEPEVPDLAEVAELLVAPPATLVVVTDLPDQAKPAIPAENLVPSAVAVTLPKTLTAVAANSEHQGSNMNGPGSKLAISAGYNHYKAPLRPIKKADGIADYTTGKKQVATSVDGIADYINHEPSVIHPEQLPSDSIYALFNSQEALDQTLITAVQLQDKKLVRILQEPRRGAAEPVLGVLSALSNEPVVIEPGGNAPSIVIEPLPKPEPVEPELEAIRPAKKNRGFSGAITLANSSFKQDGFSITGNASYKVIKDSYWFIRSSGNYQFDSGQYRYTWGIGYDDWHPGTFSVQLNHWGPLLPGDYLDIDNAIASVTYKFNKNSVMDKFGLSSSVTLSQKISGDPIFSWSNSWNPKGKWFVRSTISQPLKGGDTSWSYGFGYANYSPFTFSFEYNNWGYNKAFEYNVRDNGVLAFTYRWAY